MKMEKESKIYALIKAVEKPYFDSFINEGQICMNTAKWFREYEKQDNNIGDAGEGVIASCGKGFTISFADPIKDYSSEEELKDKISKSNWSKSISGEKLRVFDEDNANILSLYAITISDPDTIEHQHFVPQEFIDEFPDHRFILILNPEKFITRVTEELTKLNKLVKKSIVRYYPLDSSLRENLTFFHKQDYYSYQNEYRLIIQDKNPERLIFNIGSINDICIEINLCKQSYKGEFDNINVEIMLDAPTSAIL